MSVLIRGMQIQDNCKECRMRTDYDFCSAMPKEFCGYTNDIRRPDWCPLVELPEKHGRLIDADELKIAFPRCDNNMDIKIASVRATVNHMPTIIEAEEV